MKSDLKFNIVNLIYVIYSVSSLKPGKIGKMHFLNKKIFQQQFISLEY